MALGVLFPVLFHAVGLGPVFLPMFWPIAMSVFFLPLQFTVFVAILTPIVSSLLTGMPPISPPVLHIMIVELLVMAISSRLLFEKTQWGVFWILVCGLLASRLVLYVMVGHLAALLGLPEQLSSTLWVLRGGPGVLLILASIPVLVQRILHHSAFLMPRKNWSGD